MAVSSFGSAEAFIINLDALTATNQNPVVLSLAPGAYSVTPVGIADGGAYNAWNAWGYVSLPHSGWLNQYVFASDSLGEHLVTNNVRYATDLQALQNALGSAFYLPVTENVKFYMGDNYYSDNIGGMSLDVKPVPEPATLFLLGSGFIGMLGLRKKKASV